MTLIKQSAAVTVAGAALGLSLAMVSAASALTTSCVGTASTSSVTWTASSAGGVDPVVILWGNGSTSSVQTIAEIPGTYSMTLQATDASSSVATTTCSATVAAPATTTATTTTIGSSIAAQIQALLAQIAALKAQIAQILMSQVGSIYSSGTGTSTPVTVGCFESDHDLSRGDEGNDVKELQQEMAHEDPTIFPPGLITGFFGHKTEEALKHFQEKFGVGTTTGFFGPKTRNLFREHCHSDNENEDSMNSTSSASSSFSVTVHGEDEHGQDSEHGHGDHGQGHSQDN